MMIMMTPVFIRQCFMSFLSIVATLCSVSVRSVEICDTQSSVHKQFYIPSPIECGHQSWELNAQPCVTRHLCLPSGCYSCAPTCNVAAFRDVIFLGKGWLLNCEDSACLAGQPSSVSICHTLLFPMGPLLAYLASSHSASKCWAWITRWPASTAKHKWQSKTSACLQHVASVTDPWLSRQRHLLWWKSCELGLNQSFDKLPSTGEGGRE